MTAASRLRSTLARPRRRGGFTLIEIGIAFAIAVLLAALSTVGVRALMERAKERERDNVTQQVLNDARAAARMSSTDRLTIADTLDRSLASTTLPPGGSRVAADGTYFEVSYDGMCRRRYLADGQAETCEYFEPGSASPPPSGGPTPPPNSGTAPLAPRSVSTQLTSAGLVVAWQAPVGDGGSPILTYTAATTPDNRSCTATAPALTCTIADPRAGATYTVQVTATNAGGTSNPGTAPLPVAVPYPTLTVGTTGTPLPGFTYNTAAGAWQYTGGGRTTVGPDTIDAHPTVAYRVRGEARRTTADTNHRFYLGIAPRDVDGNQITAAHHMFQTTGGVASHTTLAADLAPGATQLQLTSTAGWDPNVVSTQRGVIFWNHRDSRGNLYPVGTYSRRVTMPSGGLWADGGINTATGVVTLRAPWVYSNPDRPDGVWPAGTPLSQARSGNSYKYVAASNVLLNTTWTPYSGTFGGIDYSGTNVQNMLPPGTATVSVLVLANYPTSGATDRTMQLRDVVIEPVD